MKRALTQLIDRLYLPFVRPCVPREMFRYAVCGGANMVFDWLLFFVCYHFLFEKMDWHLGFVVISPYVAALLVSSPISTLTGFWLQKNITFRASPLRSTTQLVRYVLVYFANLLIKYAGLKLLVGACGFWPLPSNMALTILTVIFSFLMQKYFTFRRKTKD
jgi:putative flippase GtrA